MNIWTIEKEDGAKTELPVIAKAINKHPELKISEYQREMEEGFANSVYAYTAWKNHHITHMFESALMSLIYTPLQNCIQKKENEDCYPVIINVTKFDLNKLFKNPPKKEGVLRPTRSEKLLGCLDMMQKILINQMVIKTTRPFVKEGQNNTLFIIEISLI